MGIVACTQSMAVRSIISIADGVTRAATIALTASADWRFPGNSARSVVTDSGSGTSLSVARVMIPSVPSEPTSIRVRSYPATPFIVTTPVRTSSPVPRTASRAST